ncbi:MAG: hypothetical protein ABIO92_00380 [Chloroflexia bacterium]
MSDYIKYLRTVKGGATPWEIAEGSGVPAGEIHFIEVKHRRVGEDEAVLEKLAQYFGVDLGELTGRREAYRKLLTRLLEESLQSSSGVALKLESGEAVEGMVEWYSRGAVAIAPGKIGEGNYPYIVQRAWVADWRKAGEVEWHVATALRESQSTATT